jgi:hypothetical protein
MKIVKSFALVARRFTWRPGGLSVEGETDGKNSGGAAGAQERWPLE